MRDELTYTGFVEDLGCKVAFNLDGGASAQMAFMGEVLNQPSGDRMDCDILYITDTPEDAFAPEQ
jgi:exopolysaccharide biosynthesis protein